MVTREIERVGARDPRLKSFHRRELEASEESLNRKGPEGSKERKKDHNSRRFDFKESAALS